MGLLRGSRKAVRVKPPQTGRVQERRSRGHRRPAKGRKRGCEQPLSLKPLSAEVSSDLQGGCTKLPPMERSFTTPMCLPQIFVCVVLAEDSRPGGPRNPSAANNSLSTQLTHSYSEFLGARLAPVVVVGENPHTGTPSQF